MISVLFVDDEPAILEISRLFLERFGDIKVHTARSAPEALILLKNMKFDVIVTDFEMPEMDGLVFLKILRAEGDRIPIILFTGKGREWVAMEALNNGADFYLIKGEDPKLQFAELSRMIHQAVQRRQVEESLPVCHRKLVDLIHYIPEPTFAIDPGGVVISWNKAMETLTGVKSSDILLKGEYEYSLPFYGERRPILIDLVLKNDDSYLNRLYYNIKKDASSLVAETNAARLKGKEVFLWAKATRIFDSSGNLLGAIESVRDVTDLKISVNQQQKKVEKDQATGFFGRFLGKNQDTSYDRCVDLYYRQGRYQEALTCFEQTIRMKEDHAGAWKGKGLCLKELGLYEEALPCFARVIGLAPADQEGYYFHGETLEKIGKSKRDMTFYRDAIKSFEHVIDLDPENIKAWNYSGLCYKELGKLQEAKRCFEHAQFLIRRSRDIVKRF
ncbi:MAG: response regulator [Methanoregulaceae archaeon]|nr:response regulator [Methanoregulaceae archaeon]